MIVTVEGLCLESNFEEKEDREGNIKTSYRSMVFQSGEKENTVIKSQNQIQSGMVSITGRLMSWKTRDGVGLMVLAEG